MARLSAAAREELLSAYLDGELSRAETRVVRRLLAESSEAVTELRDLETVRRAVRLLPELQVPARLLPDGHYGDRLSAYLDGELVTAETRIVGDHLSTCRACREELHTLDRARIAIRALPGVEPPEILDLRRDVEDARRRIRIGRMAVWAGGVAAALFLLMSLAAAGRDQPSVDLADLGDRHVARASATSGISILPALSEANPP